MAFITLGGAPLSTNHIYKSHARFGHACVYMSKEGKARKDSYKTQALAQYKEKMMDGSVAVHMKVYRLKNIGDIDAFNKLALDALTGVVWEDDRQIVELRIEKFVDKEYPRIELDVVAL